MSNKKNKILTQGIFDGHCLQYSVMNAFKALNDPASTAHSFAIKSKIKWQKIISLTPSLQNFSSGWGSEFGINTLDVANRVLENIFLSYFEALSEKTNFVYSAKRISINQIKDTNFSNSVLIFCLKEKAKTEQYKSIDHWVCGIGVEEESILLSCSFVLHETEDGYSETVSKYSGGRYYNNSINISEILKNRIYTNQVYCVEGIKAK